MARVGDSANFLKALGFGQTSLDRLDIPALPQIVSVVSLNLAWAPWGNNPVLRPGSGSEGSLTGH